MKKELLNFIIENHFNFEKIAKEFPIIQELKEVPQDPIFHQEGNVKIHTSLVCDEIKKLEEWQLLDHKEKAILYLAALFHDIGKKSCTRIENSHISSPNHAIKGAKLFRQLFYQDYSERYTLDFHSREKIASLIRYHGLPLLFLYKKEIDYQMIKASFCTDLSLLYLLAKADLLGRQCIEKDTLFQQIEYFKEYACEINCFHQRKQFANPFTKSKYFYENTICSQTNLYDTTKFDVMVMSGLPLSGKDTYIQNNLSDFSVISLDEIREEFHLSPAKGSGKAVSIAKERAKILLRKQIPFVWNATNLNRENRDNLYLLFSSYGARVKFIYLEVPYSELQYRNQIRKRNLPDIILNRMIQRFDMIDPFEGYELKYFVSSL